MDEANNMLMFVAVTNYLTLLLRNKRKIKYVKKKRQMWTRAWLQRREVGRGILNMLNNELLFEDSKSYKNYLRMSNECFEKLLSRISNDIRKEDTCMRQSISARNRLEVTLRYLATGETFRSLMYSTRIHETTISRFIMQVCEAIHENLSDYINTPTASIEWEKIASDFDDKWQFPHCLGAIDGRHIKFRPPRSDGSFYFNYKGENSLVLLAVADANYKFVYCNIGCNGRVSDGGVFRECRLSEAIESNSINIPPPDNLPGRVMNVPYVFVADDAFPLSTNIMKPYPNRGLSHEERIFNYRLSRSRRIVENAFGILANRFRVLLTPINLRPSKVQTVTLTCVALHNFLVTENGNTYSDCTAEELNCELQQIGQQGGNKSSCMVRRYRDEFKSYFCTNGAVPWQENSIQRFNL